MACWGGVGDDWWDVGPYLSAISPVTLHPGKIIVADKFRSRGGHLPSDPPVQSCLLVLVVTAEVRDVELVHCLGEDLAQAVGFARDRGLGVGELGGELAQERDPVFWLGHRERDREGLVGRGDDAFIGLSDGRRLGIGGRP